MRRFEILVSTFYLMSRSFEFLAFFDFFVVNFGGLPNIGIFFFMHYKFSFQIDVDGAYQKTR